jgi:catechol 2,3-dioxygenase-like lactoylglutathione lyase family enzyme
LTSIVLWVEDLDSAKTFYSALLSASIVEDSATFVKVASASNEVLLHLVPEQYREGISSPPQIREEAVIKPVFAVASISASRVAVAELNGRVYGAETEQIHSDARYCDGFDTEGNVIQVSERA